MTIEHVAVLIRQTINQEINHIIDTFAKKPLSMVIEHVTVQIRQTLNQEIKSGFKHFCKEVPSTWPSNM